MTARRADPKVHVADGAQVDSTGDALNSSSSSRTVEENLPQAVAPHGSLIHTGSEAVQLHVSIPARTDEASQDLARENDDRDLPTFTPFDATNGQSSVSVEDDSAEFATGTKRARRVISGKKVKRTPTQEQQRVETVQDSALQKFAKWFLDLLKLIFYRIFVFIMATPDIPIPAEAKHYTSMDRMKSGLGLQSYSEMESGEQLTSASKIARDEVHFADRMRNEAMEEERLRTNQMYSIGTSGRKRGEEDDDDDEMNPFEQQSGLFAKTDHETLGRYLCAIPLRFRSSRMEELYIRNLILPNRIVQTRAVTVSFFIYSYYIFCYDISLADPRSVFGPGAPWVMTAWIIGLLVQLFLFFSSTWRKGSLYVRLFVSSKQSRFLLMLLELLSTLILLAYEYPGIPVGTVGNMAILLMCLTTGLSSTFNERIFSLLLVLLMTAVKSLMISANGYSWQGVVVYTLPMLVSLTLVFDTLYSGDKERRIRYIKTQIIASRLKGIQEENRKTEYLLSLTLPWTIVSKLKEVGMGNFDLIAERVEFASVMFTDLKNFKEIVASLGSNQEAVSLLNAIFHQMDEVRSMYKCLERIKTINSKVLIVGGLSKADHLFSMLDMALALQRVFESPLMYDLSFDRSVSRKKLSVKLEVAFGIHIGPLVAGIVGRKIFSYEVYGDVVNTSSRMLSLANGGEIIVTEQVWSMCNQEFTGSCLGTRNVKGKGMINIYSITGRRDSNMELNKPSQPARASSVSGTGGDQDASGEQDQLRRASRRRSTLRSVREQTMLFRTLNKMSTSVTTPLPRQIDTAIINSALQNSFGTSITPNSAAFSEKFGSPISAASPMIGSATLYTQKSNSVASAGAMVLPSRESNFSVGSMQRNHQFNSMENAPTTSGFQQRFSTPSPLMKYGPGASPKAIHSPNLPLNQSISASGELRSTGSLHFEDLERKDIDGGQDSSDKKAKRSSLDIPQNISARPTMVSHHDQTLSSVVEIPSTHSLAQTAIEPDDKPGTAQPGSRSSVPVELPRLRHIPFNGNHRHSAGNENANPEDAAAMSTPDSHSGTVDSVNSIPLSSICVSAERAMPLKTAFKTPAKQSQHLIDSQAILDRSNYHEHRMTSIASTIDPERTPGLRSALKNSGIPQSQHLVETQAAADGSNLRKGSSSSKNSKPGILNRASVEWGAAEFAPDHNWERPNHIDGQSRDGLDTERKHSAVVVELNDNELISAGDDDDVDGDDDDSDDGDFNYESEQWHDDEDTDSTTDNESERVIQALLKSMEARGIETGGDYREAWRWLTAEGLAGGGTGLITGTTKSSSTSHSEMILNQRTARESSTAPPTLKETRPKSILTSLFGGRSSSLWQSQKVARVSIAEDHSSKSGKSSYAVRSNYNAVRKSLNYNLKFKSQPLEIRFRRDYNKVTWVPFLHHAIRGILCQLILLVLSLINLTYVIGIDLARSPAVYVVIGTVFTGTGIQILMTGVNLMGDSSPAPLNRMLLELWSIFSLLSNVLLVSHPWDGLIDYKMLVGMVFPQFVVIHALSLHGLEFQVKVFVSIIALISLVVMNMWVLGRYNEEAFIPVLASCVWILLFSIRETNVRIEYLMDFILVTQSDMVKEEIVKASRVLGTVLPQRVIVKLLTQPNSMIYEDFEIVTVLHMDIAGFTAMSSTMEAISIFQMLNTLFTYFDHLTEEFNVQKITTIGDAYVVSSSLEGKNVDPKFSAIQVGIVALLMQAYVVNQLNPSHMMTTLKQKVAMRIGIHTGYAYGAIMGGAKNFHYDLLGDTVLIAEKIQEITPLNGVCISEVTQELLKDYHGFDTVPCGSSMKGFNVFQMKGNGGLHFS